LYNYITPRLGTGRKIQNRTVVGIMKGIVCKKYTYEYGKSTNYKIFRVRRRREMVAQI